MSEKPYERQKFPKKGGAWKQDMRKRYLKGSGMDPTSRPAPHTRSKCWVRGHTRSGRSVRGHWRNL